MLIHLEQLHAKEDFVKSTSDKKIRELLEEAIRLLQTRNVANALEAKIDKRLANQIKEISDKIK